MATGLDYDSAEVLPRLRAGDERMFTELVNAWSPALLHMARRFVPTDEAAEDAVQETWLAVVNGIDRFEGRSGLRTWVLSILIRQARRLGQREQRSIPFSTAWREERGPTVDPGRFRAPTEAEHPRGWALPPTRWDLLPETHAQSAQLRAVILAAIAELPLPQQRVIMARDVWGCDAKEVCGMLKVTANYQRVLLHRARAHLRTAVEDYVQVQSS